MTGRTVDALQRLLAVAILALTVTLGLAAPALAHTRSESHSDWQINGTHIEATIAVPDTTLKMLKPPEDWQRVDQLARYLAGKVSVTAEGKACANPGGARPLAATSQFQRVQFVFDCPSPKNFKLTFNGFFPIVPSHTDFAQIQANADPFVEQLFTADSQTIDLSASAQNPLRNASFFK